MTPKLQILPNVAGLISLIERVQTREIGLPGMAIFHGPSGWGKSSAVTLACNEFQAYFVEAQEHWTPPHLVKKIMDEIGLPHVRGVPAMVEEISKHLLKSDRPLIIDDAQYLLQKKMIGIIRSIHNSSQAPVILVGEEELHLNITRVENVHNRILEFLPAYACTLADAEVIAPYYCAGVTVDPELLGKIVDVSNGCIRRVAANLSRVRQVALSKGSQHASLADWGDRDFNTGQPPKRPKDQQAYVSASVVPLSRKGGMR